ncbi:MAG: hypothetical protein PVG71_15870 [Anaerolineae bacterium]|jgi:hypothetical protein
MSWHATLGIVYPADGALDEEYWKLVPQGVSVHIIQLAATDEQIVHVFEEQANSPDIETAASHLTARAIVRSYLVLQPHFLVRWGVTAARTTLWLPRWGKSVEDRAPVSGRKAQNGHLRLKY